jgi:hypothetical protein
MEGHISSTQLGLFLRYWTERFNPEKEDFSHAPVWIHLYSLPQEFWLEEILAGIRNTLGIYVKASEETKQRRYTSYARIYVYLNISKPLPGSIDLEYQDEEWSQTIDYEHIPFRCHKFHEHGHLFRECPLNNPSKHDPGTNEKIKDGFVTTPARCRKGTWKHASNQAKTPSTNNSFELLNQLLG